MLRDLEPTRLAPRLVAFDGDVLVQEAVPGSKLSARLNRRGASLDTLLGQALDALLAIGERLRQTGLESRLAVLGEHASWLEARTRHAEPIARAFDLAPPKLDAERIATQLAVRDPRFVKWDARPGNAIVTQRRPPVVWIDWEHAGRRNGLDNLVWVLADERVPHRPELEQSLIERHAPRFEPGVGPDQALDYVHTLGALHALFRLRITMDITRQGEWRPTKSEKQRQLDRAHGLRLAERAATWAGETTSLGPLCDWCERLSERLDRL